MSKHTPGPWRVSGVNSTDIEADSNSTFWAWVSVDTPEEERKPNALLIAAAPELLKALEVITDEYAYHMLSERSIKEEELPEVVLARKAIAKARGQQ